jgi:REP element-mobilizing transposase RayT
MPAMAHTYTSTLTHCVFSTKERRNLIPAELQPDLWAYIGGIARQHGMKALAVGGTENHAHVLLSLPATMPVAKAVQMIKACSSKWIREERGQRLFAWQQAYGAFSIGAAQIETATAYIHRQAEHHQKRDFQAEFLLFLKKNGIDYDPRYVWG